MWSWKFQRADWAIVVASLGLALLTLWISSVPVVGTDDSFLLSILWPVTGLWWAFFMLGAMRSTAGRIAIALLALGFGTSILGVAPFLVGVLVGQIGIAAGLALALGLLAIAILREPSRRVAWLVAPAIVVSTGLLVVFNVPGTMRFAIAEPELTSYAQRVERGEPQPQPTSPEPLVVGTISILEVEVDDGVVRFVTAYVGVLGDYPAGLAYAPSGAPSGGGRYEHLIGPWYRWLAVT